MLCLFLLTGAGIFIFTRCASNQPMSENKDFYQLSLKSIDGKPLSFSEFKGKKVLLVNTASQCGFTPQYADLEKLHQQYGDKLVIVGLPCNDFLSQEPGKESEIAGFCQRNYGVTFKLTEKIRVKGRYKHPVYQWLTSKSLNGKSSSTVVWNFQKYLIDEQGRLIDWFAPTTSPLSEKITRHLTTGPTP